VWLKLGAGFTEIKAYGHEDPQKLIAGIVLTGGGAQLKHQAVSRIHYGMDTRIGYPNEHLAGDSDEEFSSPLYATAVGLVMNGIDNQKHSAIKIDEIASPKQLYRALLRELRTKAGRSRGSGQQ
jgi:cell division protein FtsA